MTTNHEKAVDLHNRGCNCGQAVLAVFAEKYGLGLADALRVAGGLGGGMRSGEVCGAASGAVMAIGLRHGAIEPEDQEQKQFCGKKTQEFMKAFKERFGAVCCRDLLKENGKICNKLIGETVDMLEAEGY